ncbi:MAG: DUF445 family protein [Candidatus Brocadiae bacterium]|nr:DUF445 family protein [Candidatus Brocadiia bacterium]
MIAPRPRTWLSPATGLLAAALAGASFALPEPARRILFLAGAGGFVGWGTNALAIRMLFDRIRILGVPIPFTGVIPAKRAALTDAIASAVAHTLIRPGALREQILQSDFLPALVQVARERMQDLAGDDATAGKILEEVSARGREAIRSAKVRETLRRRLEDGIRGKGFLARTLVDPDAVGTAILDTAHEFLHDLPRDPAARERLKALAGRLPEAGTEGAKAMEEKLRPMAEAMIERALAHLDLEKLVRTNLETWTNEQVKSLVLRATREHLGWLEVWGGVLGAIAGVLMGWALSR